jgi:hypothetical protein
MLEVTLKNKEVLVKKKPKEKTEDMFSKHISNDMDSLEEYIVVQVGTDCVKYKDSLNKTILCRKDMIREVKHESFKGYQIILNEDLIFAECHNS